MEMLFEEEQRQIQTISDRLQRDSNALAVLVINKDGQEIARSGTTEHLDVTSLSSLFAGNVAATGGIAKLLANNIAVSLIPSDFTIVGGAMVPVSAGTTVGAAAPGGVGGMLSLGGGLVDKAVLGLLAVLSVGMMLTPPRSNQALLSSVFSMNSEYCQFENRRLKLRSPSVSPPK